MLFIHEKGINITIFSEFFTVGFEVKSVVNLTQNTYEEHYV